MTTNPDSGRTTRDLVFSTVDAPLPLTGAQRQKRWRATDKGRTNRSAESSTRALNRPFICWDGEGITTVYGAHLYTLFASSAGDSIQNDKGLGTREIFELILDRKAAEPDAIHFVYGASYDWNMWMQDLPLEKVNELYVTGSTRWQEYLINWRRGKSFRVTDRERGESFTVYDVVSFFQCAFVKACDDYLGDRFVHRDMIVANKAARGTFTTDDNSQVAQYNDAELENAVMLMNELRLRLDRVGLRPSRWDGPGAIAVALLKREGVHNAMATCPPDVARAARFAYAGGRFEVIKCGDVTRKAYEYDINSAYPSALRHLPNLADGKWIHTPRGEFPDSAVTFGVYRVTWRSLDDNLLRPHPFFCRKPDGTVCYPPGVTGWYWAPEIRTAMEFELRYGAAEFTVHEGYEFIPNNPDDKPFGFIDGMYLKRQALKKAGDGAHVGLKLGLNSIYGKTCQKVGARQDRSGQWRTPPFHQLEWAGWVTSHCRATILRAALEDLDSIIAFETDALFSTTPLSIDSGNGLGQWEYTEFDHLCYLQSGFYFGTVDGKPFAKTRGIDRGSMTYDDVRNALDAENVRERIGRASLTRFIGVGLARQLNDFNRWRRWETTPKEIQLEPQGKRVHEWCPTCGDHVGLKRDVWHTTYPPFRSDMVSCEYPIPWINPNPDMTDLDDWNEQRREDMAADYE